MATVHSIEFYVYKSLKETPSGSWVIVSMRYRNEKICGLEHLPLPALLAIAEQVLVTMTTKRICDIIIRNNAVTTLSDIIVA